VSDALDPTWREAVRCLDRATVRAEVMHGDTTLRDDVTLPLVCMGDSQRNARLGGGGILAMRDALDLADVLVSYDAFDANTGSVRQPPLRMAEAALMERKQEFHAQAVLRAHRTKESIEKHGRGEGSLADYYSGWKLGLARLLLPKPFSRRGFNRRGDTLLTCRDAIVVLVGRAAGSFLGDVKCGLWCRVRV